MSNITNNDGEEGEKGILGENAFILDNDIYNVYYSDVKP